MRIASLLVGRHEQLQGVFLHYRVGIGLEESFQCSRFLRRVLLLDGVHIGVVFGRILDFLLLSWLAGLRRCLGDRLLDHCRAGEHQQHDD